MRVLSGFFDVADVATEAVYRCRPRGVLKKKGVHILVGDNVTYERTENEAGVIEEVQPRKTELVRPPVANVTQALLVSSVVNPDFQPYLLDKSLVSVTMANLHPVILVTKCDLASPDQVEQVADRYRSIGYDVIEVSLVHGHGLSELQQVCQGHTSVFVGPSGVGKSSLGNALHPELGLRMGQLSEKSGRGRHTTRHTELFWIGRDTFVADAAGFSQLRIDVPATELRLYFPEFASAANDCPYRGCLHVDEVECGVKSAVKRGDISNARYDSYCTLYAELRQREATQY